jgi:hypothetical protein
LRIDRWKAVRGRWSSPAGGGIIKEAAAHRSSKIGGYEDPVRIRIRYSVRWRSLVLCARRWRAIIPGTWLDALASIHKSSQRTDRMFLRVVPIPPGSGREDGIFRRISADQILKAIRRLVNDGRRAFSARFQKVSLYLIFHTRNR